MTGIESSTVLAALAYPRWTRLLADGAAKLCANAATVGETTPPVIQQYATLVPRNKMPVVVVVVVAVVCRARHGWAIALHFWGRHREIR